VTDKSGQLYEKFATGRETSIGGKLTGGQLFQFSAGNPSVWYQPVPVAGRRV